MSEKGLGLGARIDFPRQASPKRAPFGFGFGFGLTLNPLGCLLLLLLFVFVFLSFPLCFSSFS